MKDDDKKLILNEVEAGKLAQPDIIESLTAAVKLAQTGTGGGRVMARLVLGAYNGYRFPLDISDLTGLDEKNFAHALNVIRLRYMGHEPHTFFIDGGMLFEKIATDWGWTE